MTVRQLIAALEKQDPDMLVLLPSQTLGALPIRSMKVIQTRDYWSPPIPSPVGSPIKEISVIYLNT